MGLGNEGKMTGGQGGEGKERDQMRSRDWLCRNRMGRQGAPRDETRTCRDWKEKPEECRLN